LNTLLLWVDGQFLLLRIVTPILAAVSIVSLPRPPHPFFCFSMRLMFNLVYHVTQDGWNFLGNEDVGPLIWETKQKEGGFSMIPS
jgi:hypothetical protein